MDVEFSKVGTGVYWSRAPIAGDVRTDRLVLKASDSAKFYLHYDTITQAYFVLAAPVSGVPFRILVVDRSVTPHRAALATVTPTEVPMETPIKNVIGILRTYYARLGMDPLKFYTPWNFVKNPNLANSYFLVPARQSRLYDTALADFPARALFVGANSQGELRLFAHTSPNVSAWTCNKSIDTPYSVTPVACVYKTVTSNCSDSYGAGTATQSIVVTSEARYGGSCPELTSTAVKCDGSKDPQNCSATYSPWSSTCTCAGFTVRSAISVTPARNGGTCELNLMGSACKPICTLPVTHRLVAYFEGTNYVAGSGTWQNLARLDAKQNAVVDQSVLSVPVAGTLGYKALQGGRTSSVQFPALLLANSSKYTLFHVCRVASGKGYIIRSNSPSSGWYSGHDNKGNAGVASHAVPIASTPLASSDAWVVSTDTSRAYRANGQDRTDSSILGTAAAKPETLAVNPMLEYDFVGCFNDTANRVLPQQLSDSVTSVKQCSDLAKSRNLQTFAVQASHYCFAGNNTDFRKNGAIPKGLCELPCGKDRTGANECGGIWANATYSTMAVSADFVWQVACLILYDRELSASEIESVEQTLATRYINVPMTGSPSLASVSKLTQRPPTTDYDQMLLSSGTPVMWSPSRKFALYLSETNVVLKNMTDGSTMKMMVEDSADNPPAFLMFSTASGKIVMLGKFNDETLALHNNTLSVTDGPFRIALTDWGRLVTYTRTGFATHGWPNIPNNCVANAADVVCGGCATGATTRFKAGSTQTPGDPDGKQCADLVGQPCSTNMIPVCFPGQDAYTNQTWQGLRSKRPIDMANVGIMSVDCTNQDTGLQHPIMQMKFQYNAADNTARYQSMCIRSDPYNMFPRVLAPPAGKGFIDSAANVWGVAGEVGDGQVYWLDRHDVDCGVNNAISQVELGTTVTPYDGVTKLITRYKCKGPDLRYVNAMTCRDLKTVAINANDFGQNVTALSGLDVRCDNDEVLSRFKLQRSGNNQVYYDYRCCKFNR